jgi:hypothetical protein
MRLALVQIQALLLIYAGFALLQSAARAQPLAARLSPGAAGRRARALLRLAALAPWAMAFAVLAHERGWTEAALFGVTGLVLVASVFVLLAPVAPRLVWRLALVAPALAGAAGLGIRWLT